LEGVTTFNVPESVQGFLKRASQLYGSLMTYIDQLAGFKEQDLRTWVIMHVAEIYGVVQLSGVLFGGQCQEAVTEVVKTYSLMLEKVLDWLYSGADYQTGLDLDQLAFKFEVGLYLFVAGCAGLGAIVPAPEDKEGGEDGN